MRENENWKVPGRTAAAAMLALVCCATQAADGAAQEQASPQDEDWLLALEEPESAPDESAGESTPGASAPREAAPSPAVAPAPQSDDAPVATAGEEGPPSSPAGPEPRAAASSGAGASTPVATAAAASQTGVDPAPARATSSEAPLETIPVRQRAEPETATLRRDPQRVIEEIIVTATKREQSLRDIPISIDAVLGDELEAEAAGDLQDYVGKMTGISQNRSSYASSRITVRGVGFETMPGAATLQTTGILINDAAFNDPFINSVSVDLYAFDLASVEVLKGPQGTLFGAAALGGAVRYVLAEPVPGEWEHKLFTQYTSKSEGAADFGYGVAVNLPLWDGGDNALRLVWIDRTVPGVYDDLRFGLEDTDTYEVDNLRAQFLWAPDAPYKLKLLYLSQQYDGYAVGFADNTEGRLTYANQQVPADELPTSTAFDLASVELSYQFEGMRLGSYTHHTHKETDTIVELTRQFGNNPPPEGGPAVLFHVIQDINGLAQEFRLQSTDGGDLQWLLGAYGFLYDHFSFTDLYTDTLGADTGATDIVIPGVTTIENPTAVGSSGSLFVADFPADATEISLFGEGTYRLWERLDLTAGLRVYQTRVEGGTRDGRGLLIAALNNGMELNAVNEIKEQGINPKLAFRFDASEITSLYGNAARGFRFGGVQLVPGNTGTSRPPPTYKSDTLWNYELGVRNTLLDGAMQIDAAAFYVDWKDPQIQQRDPNTAINFTTNASGATIVGGELEFLYLPPIEGLRLSLVGSYTRARINESFTDGNGVVIAKGTPLPGTPEWQGNASVQYGFNPVDSLEVLAGLSYNYASEAFNSLTREVSLLDYGAFHANLNFGLPHWRGAPRLTINVFNLLDERVVTNAWFTEGDPEDSIDTWYLPPRTINIKLDLSF